MLLPELAHVFKFIWLCYTLAQGTCRFVQLYNQHRHVPDWVAVCPHPQCLAYYFSYNVPQLVTLQVGSLRAHPTTDCDYRNSFSIIRQLCLEPCRAPPHSQRIGSQGMIAVCHVQGGQVLHHINIWDKILQDGGDHGPVAAVVLFARDHQAGTVTSCKIVSP